MANKIFDRDTLLDLTVNIIPLFIIAFFVVAFAVVSPFGLDPLASAIQFGLLVIPFVLLTVLTYFSGKAIAGAELHGEVYLPGQAGVEGAKPLKETELAEEHLESDSESPSAVEGDEGDAEATDADDASDADSAEDEADPEADAEATERTAESDA